MNVIPMITFKRNLNHACALTNLDIHNDIIYHIPFNGKH